MNLAEDLWPLLEEQLFPREGDHWTFNPWRDRNPDLDVEDAPAIRRENLRSYLSGFPTRPRLLLVGEAPSWRGCRFSGIAFTAEAQLEDGSFPVDGRRTSAFQGPVLSEASASLVWGSLQHHFPDFLLWNALPVHPHPEGEPRANRTPGPSQVDDYGDLLRGVVETISPLRVVAVGRTAEGSLERLGIEHTYVRHPAQGGARKFRTGMRELLAET
jgi:hypothetical protein